MPQATLRAVAPAAARKGTSMLGRCMLPGMGCRYGYVSRTDASQAGLWNEFLYAQQPCLLDEYWRDGMERQEEGFNVVRLPQIIYETYRCQYNICCAAIPLSAETTLQECMESRADSLRPGLYGHQMNPVKCISMQLMRVDGFVCSTSCRC
jgi:hypothetical protein